eukprot:1091814-Rhodomonas_salina.1
MVMERREGAKSCPSDHCTIRHHTRAQNHHTRAQCYHTRAQYRHTRAQCHHAAAQYRTARTIRELSTARRTPYA